MANKGLPFQFLLQIITIIIATIITVLLLKKGVGATIEGIQAKPGVPIRDISLESLN